ncbi:HsdM family class I SAM-dependent methyltransferase [Flavobacterium johnsoniae]|uniref:site-specific DNA-methyltransferase (adenine-specific) n=1 Tax=Flavobacterium johnsoniae TaxID=986 RepID=A0A1J7BPP5_FLAJO|nr:N-6 DNA methylase [Flavobacterium johnsoniae]OIV40667.1 restriction endonuclease [Flavobacterium johnsoniae]
MAKGTNERITENIVRDTLRNLGYYEPNNGITIEEQKSEIAKVKALLSKSSKNQKGNSGYPEFIISNKLDPNFLIVFECKPDTKKHASFKLDKPVDFAVDGAIHYAKHLSEKYTVLAIAISGTTLDSLKISNYIFPSENTPYKELVNEHGHQVTEILPFEDYYRLSSFDPEVAKKRHSDLISFSRELHEFIWAKAKVSEEDKPLLVSGTLIALMNNSFQKTYSSLNSDDIQEAWINAIKKELNKAEIPQGKKDTMIQPYTAIAVHPNLGKPDTKTAIEYPDGVFKELIDRINENVWPFISIYHDFDVVGQFYGEFLKYTAGDKKALGIVLTPKHIAELFSLIANVHKDDIVLDICAGTGGFLISAMQHMLKTAVTEEERLDIKKNRLIGIENSPKMFALAASNMILRGDGKANLHQGSCFDEAITASIKKSKPTVGMLNPPYSQSKSDAELHELYFVKHMLDLLQKGATGIAIIPMNCVISPHLAKQELLNKHTLKAVMTMPIELFYPVGAPTCIVVFEAHTPHLKAHKKTWFGYWREDGYMKTKHLGRIDLNNKWSSIRDRWIESYRNNEIHPGESVSAHVTADDEWVAEAYLETDYSTITKNDFEKVVRDYAVFKMLNEVN